MAAICSVVIAVEGGLLLVGNEGDLLLGRFPHVIDVDDARLLRQPGPHGIGRQQEVFVLMIGLPIDFGHDAGDHRRAGRRLHEFHASLVPIGNRLQLVPHPQTDGVALQRAVLLARQIDPQLGHVVALPEIVVAHEAVEVHRRGQPDIARVIGDFGHAGQVGLEVADGGVGAFQGGALVEVEHQQQLVLVVEGQHLQGDVAHRRQSHCPDRQQRHAEQERPGHQPRVEQRRHQRIEELVERRLLDGVEVVRVVMGMRSRSPLPLGEG